MATHLSVSVSVSHHNCNYRSRSKLKGILLPSLKHTRKGWKLSAAVDQIPQESRFEVKQKQLVDFLYEDLPHLFDDQGIDPSMYDEHVKFRDPITKHDTISGYIFNINLLKKLFQPVFQLHYVKQTGPYEITTRWTMVMKFIILPWKPELVFTGISIMGINPETQKFCSHADLWDSIQNNEYFSLEGLWDVVQQVDLEDIGAGSGLECSCSEFHFRCRSLWLLVPHVLELRFYKTPDLESPKYQILKRTANYEVRKYSPFVVVETNGDKLSGSTGFNDVAGYIFGKNSASEKIPMTTPVFTQTRDDEQSKIAIQIVLPMEKDFNSLPSPSQETLRLRKVEGGIAAISKFSGNPREDVVGEKEIALRSALVRDGFKPKEGCMFARYNDPGRTWDFIMVCAVEVVIFDKTYIEVINPGA